MNHHPGDLGGIQCAPSPPHLKAKGPHRSSLIDPSSLPLLSFGLFTAAIENLWNFALSAVCQLGLISREQGSRLAGGRGGDDALAQTMSAGLKMIAGCGFAFAVLRLRDAE